MIKKDILTQIEKMKPQSALFISQEEWYNYFNSPPKQVIYELSLYPKYRAKFQDRTYATKTDKRKGMVAIIRWN